MRLTHALLAFSLFVPPAFAATDTTTNGAEHHGRRSSEQHFADANTSHDGKLTLDQARTGYKSLVKSFEHIDANHRGYITLDDIKAWRAAKKAARRTAKMAEDQELKATPAVQRGTNARAIGTSSGLFFPGANGAPRLGVDVPNIPANKPRES